MKNRKVQFSMTHKTGVEKDYESIQALDAIRKELGFEAMCIHTYTRLGVPDYTVFIGVEDRDKDLLANDKWSDWLSNTGRWSKMADYDSCLIAVKQRSDALSYEGYFDYVDDTEIYGMEACSNGRL